MTIEKRIERIEAILDARGLDWDHPRVEEDHFADASKMVADEPPKKWRILEPGEVVCSSHLVNAKSDFLSDPPSGPGWRPVEISVGMTVHKDDFCVFACPVADEPAKEPEPEHPAGPMPDPGEGYRLLSKDPPEDLTPGDEFEAGNGKWIRSSNAETDKKQSANCWYRRKIETPKPAWEPKVGDRVLVTRPQNWKEWKDPLWREEMHIYDGRVFELVKWSQFSTGRRASLQGIDWFFHRDWLSPAEPPAIDKPAEPEYREPVLPADAGKVCEFSDDGETWQTGTLFGFSSDVEKAPWESGTCLWEHARIKKDA